MPCQHLYGLVSMPHQHLYGSISMPFFLSVFPHVMVILPCLIHREMPRGTYTFSFLPILPKLQNMITSSYDLCFSLFKFCWKSLAISTRWRHFLHIFTPLIFEFFQIHLDQIYKREIDTKYLYGWLQYLETNFFYESIHKWRKYFILYSQAFPKHPFWGGNPFLHKEKMANNK